MNRGVLVIIGTFTPPLHGNMRRWGESISTRKYLQSSGRREGELAKWLIHDTGVEQLSRLETVGLLELVFIAVAAWPGVVV